MEINKKMDLQVASLKTVLESLKLETIRYLAGKTCSRLASHGTSLKQHSDWTITVEGRSLENKQDERSGVVSQCDSQLFSPVFLHSDGVLLPRHRSGSVSAVEVKDPRKTAKSHVQLVFILKTK